MLPPARLDCVRRVTLRADKILKSDSVIENLDLDGVDPDMLELALPKKDQTIHILSDDFSTSYPRKPSQGPSVPQPRRQLDRRRVLLALRIAWPSLRYLRSDLQILSMAYRCFRPNQGGIL